MALDTLSQTYDEIKTPITDMNIESSNDNQMSNSSNNSTKDLSFNSTIMNTTSELENTKNKKFSQQGNSKLGNSY
ncbi:6316_t:CDS:2 [Cetraspora pellucida]|uniref:6316_t:CDS:1 n=1 Tax=Cetraspora pellucida TaxID=1433469 RepID=A0ACA9LHS8_9GLOM|nr:6316_t:CDS:2 [Cetraspora pellucida]